ncbi:MAG TPA: hypothetical protein VMU99_00360 [Acidimicrobiales bacterium]|nr:hypothetical protein [Acidimicrobiales bacterium]
MLVKLVLIALVMVIIGLLALRFRRESSIERSISGHHRRLGSIHEIVERTAERNTRDSGLHEVDRGESLPTSALAIERKAINARAEIEITDDRRVSNEGRLVFGDLSITPVKPPVPPIYGRRPKRPAKPGSGEHFKVPGASAKGKPPRAAAVLLVLVVFAGGVAYYLHSRSKSGALTVPTTSTTIRTPPRATANTASKPSSTATRLVASTVSSATYSAPAGSYLIKVDATGPCWVGFKHRATQSRWLAMSTIGESGVNSVDLSTSGHLVIVIGNPPNLKEITVNGAVLGLPKLQAAGFDVIFK